MDLLRVSTAMYYLAVVIGLMHIVERVLIVKLPDLNNYVYILDRSKWHKRAKGNIFF